MWSSSVTRHYTSHIDTHTQKHIYRLVSPLTRSHGPKVLVPPFFPLPFPLSSLHFNSLSYSLPPPFSPFLLFSLFTFFFQPVGLHSRTHAFIVRRRHFRVLRATRARSLVRSLVRSFILITPRNRQARISGRAWLLHVADS